MSIDNERDLAGLTLVGQVVAETLQTLSEAVKPGVSTAELDEMARAILLRWGARSAPQIVYDFPGLTCISLNDEAVHGIPNQRVIKEGDLVKVDVTLELDGYMADAATTVAVPPVEPTAARLRDCARLAFEKALPHIKAGNRVYHIGKAVEKEVKRHGFSVLRPLCGHGVGRSIHEEPAIPNFYDRRYNQPLTEGMVITVEPIISARRTDLTNDDDGWTIRTADGCLSAHYEHTLVVTRGLPMLLTAC